MAEPTARLSKYPNVVRAISETPWAILPETLAVIKELVAFRAAGGVLTREEIQAQIGAGPAQRQVSVSGTVAILPLYGVLFPRASLFSEMSGGTSLQRFGADIDAAVANPNVAAILIDVHSPGGSTFLATETAAKIRNARGQKPIAAIANALCASCAYHIASQADELVGSPSALLGSIGVFAAHEDWSKFDDALGVKTTLISAGKHKTEGNEFEPLSDEARQAIQKTVDDTYALMVADVAKGRGVRESEVRERFTGRVHGAKEALELGLIDRVDTYESTLSRLARGDVAMRAATKGQLEELALDDVLGPRAAIGDAGEPEEDHSEALASLRELSADTRAHTDLTRTRSSLRALAADMRTTTEAST